MSERLEKLARQAPARATPASGVSGPGRQHDRDRRRGAPGIVRDVVSSPGEPLDPASRALMEDRFRHDFSGVRVHADARAAASANAVDAKAYTVGRDVVFGEGRYDPGSASGRRLLAHELTHVVQQGTGDRGGPLEIAPAGTTAEAEAERAARAIDRPAAGIRPGRRTVVRGLQRSPLSDRIRDTVGPSPVKLERLLERLMMPDVQGAPADTDLDAELGRLLAGRPDDLWVAQRIRRRQLGQTSGAFGPKQDGKPVARPIEAHYFRGTSDRRALVIAGVHGSERQGMDVARRLIADLTRLQPQFREPFFTTIVVPSLFPDNAARGQGFSSEGRESGPTPTNRNFPTPDKDLAASGSEDARKRPILPENVLLLELMERFKPERIISIHGTWDPNLAGVFYDPRALRADEQARAATHPGGEKALKDEAKAADERLSLAAARQIDTATRNVAGREDRVDTAARRKHPSVAGNVGATGALDRPFWAGGTNEGVSLGGYAPPRGMSVFTVEPAHNANTADYDQPGRTKDAKVTAAMRAIELQAYADAVRTILLGDK